MTKSEKSEYVRTLSWVKKVLSLKYLKTFNCTCGENNIVKLCFHHIDNDKEQKISSMRNLNFEKIKGELDKCVVMCQNCHQELHSKLEISEYSEFKKKNKMLFMKFMEKDRCERCGYNKCLDSLDLHHKFPENKTIEFRIFRRKVNSVSEISEHIKNELNSCELICRNCHMDEHNGEYFSRNKEFILQKATDFKGIQSKLPVDDVIDMYKSGMRQIDIAKHFSASKGTISDIIRRNKLIIFGD